MEIAIIAGDSIKIKGKTVSFIINPQKPSDDYQGALYLKADNAKDPHFGQGISIDGTGEYEVGGVKIKATKKDNGIIYVLNVDGVNIILGNLSILEKMQGKYQDMSVVCVNVDIHTDPSFMSGFANHYIIYFGEKMDELSSTFLKGEITKQSKLQTTKEMPQELQTILLA